jgi:hypothetical protein
MKYIEVFDQARAALVAKILALFWFLIRVYKLEYVKQHQIASLLILFLPEPIPSERSN